MLKMINSTNEIFTTVIKKLSFKGKKKKGVNGKQTLIILTLLI